MEQFIHRMCYDPDYNISEGSNWGILTKCRELVIFKVSHFIANLGQAAHYSSSPLYWIQPPRDALSDVLRGLVDN